MPKKTKKTKAVKRTPAKPQPNQSESGIAAAVGTSASVGLPREQGLGKRVEEAMTKAVEDALAQGVSMDNVEEIKRRKMAARLAILRGA
jgi:hypothetical protein